MKKVIIAEGVYKLLKKEKSFFNRSDIRILKADTNGKALSLHRAEKANLIIANLDAPDMSGEKLCSIIRGDDGLRSVSIIIVCAGSKADLRRCTKCSANVFISSPVNNAVLLQEAHSLLNIAPRKSCRVPVGIRFTGTSEGKPFTGHIENISLTGMLFRSAAVLFEGDAIICSFSLPGSAGVTASAEIVRVLQAKPGDEAGYGISFTDIGPEAVSAIEYCVTECEGLRPENPEV